MPRPYIGPILRTRVSPDALARVDALAAAAGTTRAEVARAIIEERVTPPRTCAYSKIVVSNGTLATQWPEPTETQLRDCERIEAVWTEIMVGLATFDDGLLDAGLDRFDAVLRGVLPPLEILTTPTENA